MTALNTDARGDLDSLIRGFTTTRTALIEAAAAVPETLRDAAFVGTWDLKDVVSHTIGWDYTNVEALPDFAAGRLPAFFAGYDTDWASINAALVARYGLDDWDALMESLQDAGGAFVAALGGLSDADLDNAVAWNGRHVSLRGMLRAISRDEAEHVRQVLTFVTSGQRVGNG